MTTDRGSILDGPGQWQPWERNPGVEVLVRVPRQTTAGDVIVDPQGNAYRVGREGFQEIEAAAPVTRDLTEAAGDHSCDPAALFREWRDDYAAAWRRDTGVPPPANDNDRGIER